VLVVVPASPFLYGVLSLPLILTLALSL
jgi:hypothetical protein